QGAFRDLQLHVELPKIEIGLRHATHNLQGDGSSALLPSQEIRQARLIRPTDSPPDIQLPGQRSLPIFGKGTGETGEYDAPHAGNGKIARHVQLRGKVDASRVQTRLVF